ncbi:MAG: hypothetical protein LBS31_03860, partial [Candidatus Adiutrix sp.]|nr:hypothetical protein [Candidatus Adiutrix sp.]
MTALFQDKPDRANGFPKIFRPAVRSVWFLLFGVGLGPAVIFFGRDPDGRPAKWLALSLVCLALALHRLSLRYALTPERLSARAWWGLWGSPETVTLAHIREVRAAQGFCGRLAGCGHLEIFSY